MVWGQEGNWTGLQPIIAWFDDRGDDDDSRGETMRGETMAAIGGRVGVSARAERIRALVVGVLVGAGLCAGPLAASAGAHPLISGFEATPASVESGGTTTVSASVSGAKTCKLRANKPVSGLPATFACEGEPAAVSRELTMPANTGSTAVTYKLSLSARGTKTEGIFVAERSVIVRPTGTATQVASGYQHSCALLSTGHIDCWGYDKQGQLGNGTEKRVEDNPVEVENIGDASQVAAGGDDSCALLSTGHIDCWGDNMDGQLGDGSTTGSLTPVEVQDLVDPSQVTAGGDDERAHACGLLSTGHIDCWGSNQFGELGNGGSTKSDMPVEVQDITDATQVSAGDRSTCAVLATGHIDCWGSQLGNGTDESSNTPVEVQDITNATQVAVGGFSTCAVLSTGHIDCWGANEDGQLGDGTTESTDTPVEVQGITEATRVSAGELFTCAVLSTGHAGCWGAGGLGQLGDGSTVSTDAPVEVQDISSGSQVAAGSKHACALVSTSQVECWGYNKQGQLGDPSDRKEITDTPVGVFGL
jgi:alpha-tubulin suppressor-like RCC1 family protein